MAYYRVRRETWDKMENALEKCIERITEYKNELVKVNNEKELLEKQVYFLENQLKTIQESNRKIIT